MMKRTKQEGTVEVVILKPFHIGISKPVYYKAGAKVKLNKVVAEKAIARQLAEPAQVLTEKD